MVLPPALMLVFTFMIAAPIEIKQAVIGLVPGDNLHAPFAIT